MAICILHARSKVHTYQAQDRDKNLQAGKELHEQELKGGLSLNVAISA